MLAFIQKIKRLLCKHDYWIRAQKTIYDPDNNATVVREYECSKCGHRHIKIDN